MRMPDPGGAQVYVSSLAGRSGERAQLRVGELWVARLVRQECAAHAVHPPAALLAAHRPLDDQIALAGAGLIHQRKSGLRALDQQRDASTDRCRIGRGERDLLAHDRGERGRIYQHELLEIALLRIVRTEHVAAVKAVNRRDGAVMRSESRTCGLAWRALGGDAGDGRHAEHAIFWYSCAGAF
jgi:hypothetical protein